MKIVEELCGMDVSSTAVARAAAELDKLLRTWRERELGSYRYVILNAQYEEVRRLSGARRGCSDCVVC